MLRMQLDLVSFEFHSRLRLQLARLFLLLLFLQPAVWSFALRMLHLLEFQRSHVRCLLLDLVQGAASRACLRSQGGLLVRAQHATLVRIQTRAERGQAGLLQQSDNTHTRTAQHKQQHTHTHT